jgi:hypothetical protein
MTTSKPNKPLAIAPNIKAAFASWGVPVAVLKAAKAQGCDAFSPGGRIDRAKFMQWLNDNSQAADTAVDIDLKKADKTELESERLRAQIVWQRLKNDRESKTTISRAEAVEAWARAMSILQEEFRQLMEPERYAIACERAKMRIAELLPE